MTRSRWFVLTCGVLWVWACMAIGQDSSTKRIETLEKQIQHLTKELQQIKAERTIDKRIDELANRMKGLEDRKPEATAGRKKGFYIKSADDLFAIQFFGRVQLDWWSYEGGNIEPWGGADFSNTFFLRRAHRSDGKHERARPRHAGPCWSGRCVVYRALRPDVGIHPRGRTPPSRWV